MLNKITTFGIATLLCASSLSAQDTPTKYYSVINADCHEIEDAYHFDGSTARIGHLVKLSFPSVKKELKSDISVCNPQAPEVKDPIVAVIDRISWEGGSHDPLEFNARVSFQNKAILQEALASLTDNAEVEAELIVYEYDHHAKQYFKRLHTFNKPVKLVISEDTRVYIDEDADTYKIKKPINYMFNISLSPKSGVEAQKVGFAFSFNGTQFTRLIGESL